MSLSFLYALLITTNSPLVLQTQSWIYATSSEQKDNNQEKAQTSSVNEDSPDEVSDESELSQGDINSDGSESNSNRNDDNDVSSTNQNSNCPNITEISNLPLYLGQDGCQYPCPSFDSNDENNIPEGCPIEPLTSQTNTGFSVKEENPTLSPSQEQQQVEQQQQQQNSQDSPNQNAFVSPSINSDTSTTVSNSESPTTQKSFTPGGKLRSGSTQTESSIPLLSNDVSKPRPSDSGNKEVEGTSLVQPSQTESSIPSLELGYNPAKSLNFTPTQRMGAPLDSKSQTELSIPGKANDLSGPLNPGLGQIQSGITLLPKDGSKSLTPGAGNTPVEGIPDQPNINPQTPVDPGNIPTTIPEKAYLTVITKMIGFYTGYLKVSDFEICVKSTVQSNGIYRDVDAIPRCADGSASGSKYTVQAPGSVIIWVNNLDKLGTTSLMIETPNLNNHISASESKTSTIYISPNSPQ